MNRILGLEFKTHPAAEIVEGVRPSADPALDRVAQAVAADLGQVEVEEGGELAGVLVAVEGHVAEAFGGIAARVDVVALDAAARRHFDPGGFDEGRERPGQPQTTAGKILLGQEDAVDQRVDVVLQEHLPQAPEVDAAKGQGSQLFLQPSGKALAVQLDAFGKFRAA